MQNVEIKATVSDMVRIKERVEKCADTGPEVLEQTDIFFTVQEGRLKLREVPDRKAQLIAYKRASCAGPKACEYHIHETDTPEQLTKTLGLVPGIRGVVKKRRLLYFVGRTRIHLDQVEGLGDFVELEVVLQEHESREQGMKVARDIMKNIGIREEDLVECAYIDLIDRQLLGQGNLEA